MRILHKWGVALIDIESESFSHWVWNYVLTVNYCCFSCMHKYKAMVYSMAMKGANEMRSSFYYSFCFLGIQGLLLKSLSSLEINWCALLNTCPNGNVVMLDEVGSFFFTTDNPNFITQKQRNYKSLVNHSTHLAQTKQAASCTEHTGFRQKASKTTIPSTV